MTGTVTIPRHVLIRGIPMSAIKDARLPIMLDKERHLYFSLNVIDEMQDRFGGFDKLGEVLQGAESIKNLAWLLTRLLNEGALYSQFLKDGTITDADELPERVVALLINTSNFLELKTAIFQAFSLGNAGIAEPPPADADDADYDDEEPEEGNAAGGGA